MSIYQRDSDGNLVDIYGKDQGLGLRPVDPRTEGLNPPDQLAFGENGEVLIPPEEKKAEIVEAEVKNSIDLLKRFDVSEFFNAFEENTERTLKALLSLQSNENPLKKGGDGVAFMADALFLATIEMFDNAESIVFDILCAKVSSRPEDTIYKIGISDALPYLDYQYKNKAPNNSYKKKILQKGTENISKKNALSFKIPNTNKAFDKPWHDGLLYTKVSDNINDDDIEEDYIYFKPTPIFKVLADSSTIMHGAHYSLAVSSQFSGLVKRFFFWVEGKKNYKEYPTATTGHFTVTVDTLKSLFNLPEKYKPADVKRRLLDEAKSKFAIADGMDFTFDYKDVKKGNKIVAFRITVISIYNQPVLEEKESVKDKVDEDFYNLLSLYEYKDKDIQTLFSTYVKYKRNISFLKKAIAKIELNSDIKNKTKYLNTILEKGIAASSDSDSKADKKNSFNNHHQRDYDYDELEKTLLNTNLD